MAMPRFNVEEAGLLSRSSSTDIESYHDDEKLSTPPVTPKSTQISFARSISDQVLPLSRTQISSRHLRYLISLAVFSVICGWLFLSGTVSNPLSINSSAAAKRLRKPEEKVIGLVFYGRRDRAAILDCYLKRNLVRHGGWLDEVVWGINTVKTDDLSYLDELLPTVPEYRKVTLDKHEMPQWEKDQWESHWDEEAEKDIYVNRVTNETLWEDPRQTGHGWEDYVDLWNQTIDAGNIYVKLDDDVVYIDDDAIPLVVNTLVTEPEAVIVSANMINSPSMNWLQYHTGAILPYLPDLKIPRPGDLSSKDNPIWRASDLQNWIAPAHFEPPEPSLFETPDRNDWIDYIKEILPRPQRTDLEEQTEGDNEKLPLHRWLPVKGHNAISKTPIASTDNRAFGGGWGSWAIAAQQHYSFFDNIENHRKYVYYLGHGSDSRNDAIWDQTGDRLSINFLALRGEDVLDNLQHMQENGNDEVFLSEELPRNLNRSELQSDIRRLVC